MTRKYKIGERFSALLRFNKSFSSWSFYALGSLIVSTLQNRFLLKKKPDKKVTKVSFSFQNFDAFYSSSSSSSSSSDSASSNQVSHWLT